MFGVFNFFFFFRFGDRLGKEAEKDFILYLAMEFRVIARLRFLFSITKLPSQ